MYPGLDPYSHHGPGDTRFLGAQALVRKSGEGETRARTTGDAKPEELQALREHLDRALGVLKPGVFYRLDSVASHLAFGEHNPLNLGLAPDEVAVFWMNRLGPRPWRSSARRSAGS